MRQKLLILEIGLLLALAVDYFTHYLPLKAANLIFAVALFLALYLFKPYFIWADLNKRRQEVNNKLPDQDTYHQ